MRWGQNLAIALAHLLNAMPETSSLALTLIFRFTLETFVLAHTHTLHANYSSYILTASQYTSFLALTRVLDARA